jgi:hypothetical protein
MPTQNTSMDWIFHGKMAEHQHFDHCFYHQILREFSITKKITMVLPSNTMVFTIGLPFQFWK